MPVILIADDVLENVRLLKNLLQDVGKVVFARNGLEALEQARRHRPDIVLLDVKMPELDGYETCRRMKVDPETRDIPVIFITGADSVDDEATGLSAGAIDYITKPFAPAIVRARVQNHLALVRANAELRKANDSLHTLARTDALTGIANRRHLLELGEQEMRRMQRAGTPMSVLMLDIDHFKCINDTHGHPAGDAAIQALAALCGDTVRAIDSVGRLGGEEFAILLPMTDRTGAQEVAERLRASVASHCLEWQGKPIRFTVSIGVAQAVPEDDDFSALLGIADRALYKAKKEGRNRVAVSEPGETT